MDVEDITDLMLKFKDAIRHSWNTYFAENDSPMSPEIQEAFGYVELGLFQAIVLSPLDADKRAKEYRKHPLSFILVRPIEHLLELPIQFGERESSGNVKWTMPISVVVDNQARIEFFDFFDWRPYGHVDLPLVRARIAALPSKPSEQGALALIEQHNCRFLFVKHGT